MHFPGGPGPTRRVLWGGSPVGAVSLDGGGRANFTTMPLLEQGNPPAAPGGPALRPRAPALGGDGVGGPSLQTLGWRARAWAWTAAAWALTIPLAAGAQNLFGWPLRGDPQPEAVLAGSRALFSNPGGVGAGRGGEGDEFWIAHLRGPALTGLRGMAAALAWRIPGGFRGGVGYWHLGVEDIPRTTTSPEHEPGFVRLAEDGWTLALGGKAGSEDRGPGAMGVGGGIRLQRAALAHRVRTRWAAEGGMVLRPRLPGDPLLGAALRGGQEERSALAGVEITLPPVPARGPPLAVGYGLRGEPGRGVEEHRWSVRASWAGRFQLGVAMARRPGDPERVLSWSGELVSGRYFLSVLGEALPRGMGTAHFFRLGVTFRRPEAAAAQVASGARGPGREGAPAVRDDRTVPR